MTDGRTQADGEPVPAVDRNDREGQRDDLLLVKLPRDLLKGRVRRALSTNASAPRSDGAKR